MFYAFLKLVFELFAPNRFTALSCVCWVACLHNEAFDISDEDASVVIIRCAKGEEVLSGFRRILAKYFDFDVADVRVQCDRLSIKKTSINLPQWRRDFHDMEI